MIYPLMDLTLEENLGGDRIMNVGGLVEEGRSTKASPWGSMLLWPLPVTALMGAVLLPVCHTPTTINQVLHRGCATML